MFDVPRKVCDRFWKDRYREVFEEVALLQGAVGTDETIPRESALIVH